MEESSIMMEEEHALNQGTHEIEADEKGRCTRDGTVDWKGKPSIKGKSGGWSVGILLLLNQALATLAFYGVGVNLVLFMTRVLGQDNADAANTVSNWNGTAYLFSIVGAFISDSYWGRYKTAAVFQLIFIAGLVELSLSASLLLREPCVDGEERSKCISPPTKVQTVLLYLSIYQIALGSGAYQPSVTTFGADQFDEDDKEEAHSKAAFFSYFFLSNNLGTLFSNTLLVYLEDKGQWVLGFWISAVAAVMALAVFLAGSPWYRHFKPEGNPLSRVGQVIVASMKKWKVVMPSRVQDLYEVEGKGAAINGGRKILHTPDFKFLDRAAVITDKDTDLQDQQHGPNPWKLCTITQVEELKCILRLVPIWLATIMYSVVYTQMSSIFVEQGEVMRTSISKFHIPPASVNIFEIFGVSTFVLLYRLCLIPLLSRMPVKRFRQLTELQRMAIGLVIAAITMISAGVVETQRIRYSRYDCEGCKGTSSLSILWQIPQYILMGASEVFMYVAQLEFFNNQAPSGLKSFGSALYIASMAAGNYLSSLVVTIVMKITGRGNQVGWISDDLNKGHMDKFYFLIAMLTVVDFFVFVLFAKWYRYVIVEGKAEVGEGDGSMEGSDRRNEMIEEHGNGREFSGTA